MQCLSLQFPKRDSASNHLGKPHEEDFSKKPLCARTELERAPVHSHAPEQQQPPDSHPCREQLPLPYASVNGVCTPYYSGVMVYVMYSTTADTELTPSATCQASATTLGRNRNLSLLSVPCMVLSKRGLLWVPPKWQAASSKCIRTYTQLLVCTASAPPIQDVGVLIRLFPTRFDLVPAPLQFPHSRCQNHKSEKSSTLCSRPVYCNGRCRERKERKYIFSHSCGNAANCRCK